MSSSRSGATSIAGADDLPDLPEGWNWCPLNELVDPARGICYGIVQPGAHDPLGVPMVNSGNIHNGSVEPDVNFRVSAELHRRFARSTLRGGEVLITLVGANFGQVALAPDRYAGFNCARPVGVVPVLGLAAFVMFALRSPICRHFIDSWANTTAQPTLNLKELGSIPIPVPPPADAGRISSLLSALDDRIALLRETNSTLEAIAHALFKSWFVDFDPVRAKQQGLVPAGIDQATAALSPDEITESGNGLVPSGWTVRGLTDVVHVVGGGTPKTSVPEYWNGEIPWFSVVDAPSGSDCFVVSTEKRITTLGLQNCSAKLLPVGTTIISARGTVGRLALVGRELAMNQSCYALRGIAGDAYFTYFTTRSLVAGLKQRSHGSVFDTITRETLASMLVVYPTESVIAGFEAAVGPVMERIKRNQLQVETITALRDTLLPRLISGQLRLPEAEAVAP